MRAQGENSARDRFDARTISERADGRLHLDLVRCVERLSSELCEEIAQLGGSFPLAETTVVDQHRLQNHRMCRTHFIKRQPATEPLYALLWESAYDAAQRHYGLELSRITRQPHYVEYHAGRGHFHWHNDYSHESAEAPRKVTVVIQLSHSDDYDGGAFETFGPMGSTAPRERGTIFCLPSIIPHRVTPVTRGVRKAIVAWVSGPRFK
jgi:PKHD-type hydroxylase